MAVADALVPSPALAALVRPARDAPTPVAADTPAPALRRATGGPHARGDRDVGGGEGQYRLAAGGGRSAARHGGGGAQHLRRRRERATGRRHGRGPRPLGRATGPQGPDAFRGWGGSHAGVDPEGPRRPSGCRPTVPSRGFGPGPDRTGHLARRGGVRQRRRRRRLVPRRGHLPRPGDRAAAGARSGRRRPRGPRRARLVPRRLPHARLPLEPRRAGQRRGRRPRPRGRAWTSSPSRST